MTLEREACPATDAQGACRHCQVGALQRALRPPQGEVPRTAVDRRSERGIDRLRSKTTLREILEVATEFEASARDFYSGLIPKVSKRIRYLVEEANKRGVYGKESRSPKLWTRAELDEIARLRLDWIRSNLCLELPPFSQQPKGAPPKWNTRRVLIFTENREGTTRNSEPMANRKRDWLATLGTGKRLDNSSFSGEVRANA